MGGAATVVRKTIQVMLRGTDGLIGILCRNKTKQAGPWTASKKIPLSLCGSFFGINTATSKYF